MRVTRSSTKTTKTASTKNHAYSKICSALKAVPTQDKCKKEPAQAVSAAQGLRDFLRTLRELQQYRSQDKLSCAFPPHTPCAARISKMCILRNVDPEILNSRLCVLDDDDGEYEEVKRIRLFNLLYH